MDSLAYARLGFETEDQIEFKDLDDDEVQIEILDAKQAGIADENIFNFVLQEIAERYHKLWYAPIIKRLNELGYKTKNDFIAKDDSKVSGEQIVDENQDKLDHEIAVTDHHSGKYSNYIMGK